MLVSDKTCATCRTTQPRSAYHRDRGAADGSSLDPRCRTCRKAAASTHAHDEDLKRSAHNLRIYGLTPEQYADMVAAQAGLCAICNEPETMTYKGRTKTLSVDHDHETGKVRGLLCAACNFALGKFRDNPALLRSAADYLER